MATKFQQPQATLTSLKNKAFKFITKNRAAALATTNGVGLPHVAIVYCFAEKDLSLYFSTRVEGRKYMNLMGRPIVSMTFSNETEMQSIQLSGVAKRIESLELEQKILFDLITLRYGEPNWPVPPVKLFENGATNELAIIKVTPHEMVFCNFNTSKTGRYKAYFEKIL